MNTASERLTLSIVASSSRPMVAPMRSRATVSTLSACTCETRRRPFSGEGSTVIRKIGAARSSLVTRHSVTLGSSSNRSD
jgi:hypothetical protein